MSWVKQKSVICLIFHFDHWFTIGNSAYSWQDRAELEKEVTFIECLLGARHFAHIISTNPHEVSGFIISFLQIKKVRL